jgi:hypothetical protein
VAATEVAATEVAATEVAATEAATGEAEVAEVGATKATVTEVAATEVAGTEVAATEEAAETEATATDAAATEVAATEVTATKMAATKDVAVEAVVVEVATAEVVATDMTATERAGQHTFSPSLPLSLCVCGSRTSPPGSLEGCYGAPDAWQYQIRKLYDSPTRSVSASVSQAHHPSTTYEFITTLILPCNTINVLLNLAQIVHIDIDFLIRELTVKFAG